MPRGKSLEDGKLTGFFIDNPTRELIRKHSDAMGLSMSAFIRHLVKNFDSLQRKP